MMMDTLLDIVSFLILLLLGAYGWIFKGTTDRIRSIKERVHALEVKEQAICHYPEVSITLRTHEKQMIALKVEQDKVNPVLMEIRERLAGIEAILKMKS